MSGRTRYIRQVRSIDHQYWRFERWFYRTAAHAFGDSRWMP